MTTAKDRDQQQERTINALTEALTPVEQMRMLERMARSGNPFDAAREYLAELKQASGVAAVPARVVGDV